MAKIRGYTDSQSIAQGCKLRFFLSNLNGFDIAAAPIRVFRLGYQETEVAAGLTAVPAQKIPLFRPWENNGWRVSYTLDVGIDWIPGVYAARVGLTVDDSSDVYFVVRSARPGTATPIVLQIPTTTINAYNNWGGASLYGYNSELSAAAAVSFDRPQQFDINWPRGYGFENEWDSRIKAFVKWLDAAGYVVDFITNNDLHEDPELLANYRLFISVGHDEYWSSEMRTGFDSFITSGGNAAIFSGNVCYWRIRLEPDEQCGSPNRRQVCYREARLDPIEDPDRTTTTWREAGYPENRSFGAGFAAGAGAWRGDGKPGAFTVHRPEHWVFAGTGLRQGDTFGDVEDELLLTYETNGVHYELDNQRRPIPTGTDDTPEDYLILALADLPDWGAPGNAALGMLSLPTPGGSVFNAATTDWARGLETALSGDPFRTMTAKITRNVIDYLLGNEADVSLRVRERD